MRKPWGIGKLIMSQIESITKKLGKTRIRFNVIPNRVELVAFYQRRGFKETGVFEEFPAHYSKFGLPKVAHLKLHEYEKFIGNIDKVYKI